MHIAVKITGISLIYVLFSAFAALGHEPDSSVPFERLHSHDSVEGHAHLGWESAYFSEGRDSLDGDSLLAGSFEMGWKHLAGGIWFGHSPDRRYDELQLNLALIQSVGDFEFYGGYTHLRFPFDNSHDNEIGAGFVWSGLPLDVELSVDLYYSFDANGYFTEISAGRKFLITERLALNLSVPLGINQGYVTAGHDGANYVALRLGLEYALSTSMSVILHGTYSCALGRDSASPGDEQLIDFSHWGIGLQWSF